MSLYNIVSTLLVISAFFSYLNYRYIKLPRTIGLMLITLLISLALLILRKFGIVIDEQARQLAHSIDFNKTLLQWMLCFLLFAGALHLNVDDLKEQKWTIGIFSTLSLIISTLLIASFSYFLFQIIGIDIKFIYCLLFGALISPTDPIAVLGIIKKSGTPKNLETNIIGESLFNDGVGVVLFLVLLGSITGETEGTGFTDILFLFTREAIGGCILGFILGWVTYKMLKTIDDYQVEILITIALVMGGSALADALHVSGPLAIIVAGLVIGNHVSSFAMSEKNRENLYLFWELIDEILNAILFILIGLEILILKFSIAYISPMILIIPAVLLARFISLGIPISLLRMRNEFIPNATRIMTWGGLRGGLAVALALSIPVGTERDIILFMTYGIVVFSILVQGLTVKYMVKVESDQILN
jgi:CPA1 family monovalent cation:H+ antiporter